MKAVLVALLAIHGGIHLLGFAKAFGLAKLEALRLPLSRPVGVAWLLVAVALVASAVLVVAAERHWALVALPAIVVSQVLIVLAWSDAKAGTAANLLLAVPVVLALLDLRASSFRSRFERDAADALARTGTSALLTEADLQHLPPLVQRYLRRTNVVGRERVTAIRARFRGSMKPALDASWMSIDAEQVETFDIPERLFLMDAKRAGVPFQALHEYRGDTATMQVRIASLYDVVDARGPKMDQSETVTFFNDMCLLAPASLPFANVEWRDVDDRRVLARFTNGGQTIEATLVFDADGDLVDFVSNDRFLSADGETYERRPWSTPAHDYRDFDGIRLASRAEAVWKRPEADFVYARFVIESVRYEHARAEGRQQFASGARAETIP